VVGKVANVWMVVAIGLSELGAAKAKAAPPAVDPRRGEATQRAAQTRRANAAKRKPRKVRTPKTATAVAELEAARAAESVPVSPAVPRSDDGDSEAGHFYRGGQPRIDVRKQMGEPGRGDATAGRLLPPSPRLVLCRAHYVHDQADEYH
jgi:hypothetical protein